MDLPRRDHRSNRRQRRRKVKQTLLEQYQKQQLHAVEK